MLGLQVLLAVAFCVMVLASDPLKGNLTSAGIHAVFPGGNGYASASTACTFILLFITFRTNLTIPYWQSTCDFHSNLPLSLSPTQQSKYPKLSNSDPRISFR